METSPRTGGRQHPGRSCHLTVWLVVSSALLVALQASVATVRRR